MCVVRSCERRQSLTSRTPSDKLLQVRALAAALLHSRELGYPRSSSSSSSSSSSALSASNRITGDSGWTLVAAVHSVGCSEVPRPTSTSCSAIRVGPHNRFRPPSG